MRLEVEPDADAHLAGWRVAAAGSTLEARLGGGPGLATRLCGLDDDPASRGRQLLLAEAVAAYLNRGGDHGFLAEIAGAAGRALPPVHFAGASLVATLGTDDRCDVYELDDGDYLVVHRDAGSKRLDRSEMLARIAAEERSKRAAAAAARDPYAWAEELYGGDEGEPGPLPLV